MNTRTITQDEMLVEKEAKRSISGKTIIAAVVIGVLFIFSVALTTLNLIYNLI